MAPLIGNFYNTNDIERYRYYYSGAGRDGFLAACARVARDHHLHGLNFDFEPSATSCAAASPPCGDDDAAAFAQLLSDVKSDLKGLGPGGADTVISVDTGQSIIAKTGTLKVTTADRLITMNTYGDTSDYDIALPRDLTNDGQNRFGLGVCPGCFNSTDADVAHRIDLAIKLGVKHVGYWAGSDIPAAWLAGLRRWKQAPLPSPPSPSPPLLSPPLLSSPAPPSPPAVLPFIRASSELGDPHFYDSFDRVRIFHGVNRVKKAFPW